MTAGTRIALTRPFYGTVWFPLLTVLGSMLLVMVAAWQLTGISFKPYDALVLDRAAFFPDSKGVCSPSISDSLAYANDVPEPIATQLLNCVQQLGQTGSAGREVNLPHEWRSQADSFPELMSGRGLYHVSLALSGNQPVLYGLYLPAVSSNAAVFLNDVLLGWGGSFEQPVARNATRPMLFSIPAGLLREDRNWIDVYVVAEPVPRGFLDKLYLAPIEVLEAAYHDHGIFRHEVPRTIALSLLVISLFIGVLWFYRRKETEYGLFALASLCWAVNAMDQFVVDIPLPVFFWDWLMMFSLSGFVFLGVMFVHRFLHEAHPQIERLMLVIGVPVALLCLVLPRDYAYRVVLYVWNPV
ncbi:MAG: hypothetical protein KDI15_10310, partial [Thiothrix sp.]|nr:hypothetical protein [Thiothrix sp.]